jgi:hypothetical protein
VRLSGGLAETGVIEEVFGALGEPHGERSRGALVMREVEGEGCGAPSEVHAGEREACRALGFDL